MKMRRVFLFIAAIFVATAVFVLPEETKAAGSSVKIGGVELVNDNAWHAYNSKKPTISGWTAGKYKLTKDRATLYLDGVKYSGKKRGISGNGALKIVTTGANTITTTDARGICLENADEVRKNLTFAAGSATSTLTVKSTNAYALAVNSLTKGAGTLNITGNADCEGNLTVSEGTLKATGYINCWGNYKITGGTVTVGGDFTCNNTVTISGGTTTTGDFYHPDNLNVTAGTLKSNGEIMTETITASGGTITAVKNIDCRVNITVSAGTIKSSGTMEVSNNYKITGGTVTVAGLFDCQNTVAISGGSTTIGSIDWSYKGHKLNVSAGVFKSNGDITFEVITASGGTMTASTDITCNSMTVSGATVTAQGAVGVSEDLTISKGELKVTGNLKAYKNYKITGGTVTVGGEFRSYKTVTISGGTTTVGDVSNSINLNPDGKLNVTAGTFKSNGDITFEIITASGGTLTAMTGITCENMTVSGATVTAQGTVWVWEDLTISKGELSSSAQNRFGVMVIGNAKITGGNCNIYTEYYCALHVAGLLTVSDGTMTATCKGNFDYADPFNSCIYVRSLDLSGGSITSTADDVIAFITEKFEMTDGIVYASSEQDDAFYIQNANIADDIWLSLPNDGYFNEDQTVVYDKNGNTANEVELKKMSSVSIKQNPQTEYFVGDLFDPTGLVMKVEFADGTENELSYSDGRKGMFTFDRDLSEPLAVEDVSVTVNVLNGSRRIGLSVNNLAAPVVTGTSDVDTATLCWDSVDGATSYEVYKKDNAKGEFEKIDEITSTTFTDEGLTPGKIYDYKVMAKRITTSENLLYSSYSNVVSLSMDLSDPVLSLLKSGYDSVEISWQSIKGAGRYRVYRSMENGPFIMMDTVNDTTYRDRGLNTNTKYTYKVMAFSNDGRLASEYSNEVAATTTFTGRPTLTVTNNKVNYDLSWTAVDGATEYVVMRKNKGGSFEEITRTEDLTFRDTGASCHEEYTYKIIPRRVTAAGQWEASASAEVKSVPIIKDPEKAPENKEIQKVGKIGTIGQPSKGLMHIYFGKVKGATNYRIEYRKVGDKVWQKKWTGNKTKFTISKMKKGQLLEFRFAAFKTNKEGSLERGPYSNMSYRWYVATKGTVKGARKSAVVSMKKVKGATGYEVLYSTKKSPLAKNNKMKTVSAKKAKTKIKGLKSKKNYYIKFRPIKKYKGKVYRGVLVTKKVKVK